MLELTALRKQKINLSDYDYQRDIANRILLSDASPFELEVIEEIFFSPLRISLKKLARNMECDEGKLTLLLQKLSQAGLLSLDGDQILIEKESRKYFEFEMTRVSPSFKPDLEFIQGILRKVSIHFLPLWYAIPRTSNNIFESIIEKYLLTPQLFQRYLSELHFTDPVIGNIIYDLFQAPDCTLYSSDVISKYNLTRHHFEEITLLLEFHFVGYLSYRKEEDHLVEVITPFYEWHQYLRFLKQTETPTIFSEDVHREQSNDFTFIEEMGKILEKCQSKSFSISLLQDNPLALAAVNKLLLLQLMRLENGDLYPMEGSKQWLEKNLENRALHLYRHPFNLASLPGNERQVREAEKAIRRVLHGKWVMFEDFLKGVTVALGSAPQVMIQRVGKLYKYAFPSPGEKEKEWLRTIIFSWLFEAGMVAIGKTEAGKECFRVTAFGSFCFEE